MTPEQNLMMIFSRLSLQKGQYEIADHLATGIHDWSIFAQELDRHLIAPLCLKHLKEFEKYSWYPDAKQALLPIVRQTVARVLRSATVTQAFIKQMNACSTPFLFLKGGAIGAKYYPHLSLRPARDVDFWIHPSFRQGVVERAQSKGYITYPLQRRLNDVEVSIHVGKRQADISVIHPTGIKIDLDNHLGRPEGVFDFKQMLAYSDALDFGDVQTKVLSTTDSFICCCLHHANHGFLRLIWLADLDAIQRAPDFDLKAVRLRARNLGLDKTVEACLTFYQACKTADPFSFTAKHPEARDILNTCVAVSDLHNASEVSDFMCQKNPDYLYLWQDQRRKQQKAVQGLRAFLLKQFNRFRPTLADYEILPLPLSLYYVYYLLRPWFVLARKAGILKS